MESKKGRFFLFCTVLLYIIVIRNFMKRAAIIVAFCLLAVTLLACERQAPAQPQVPSATNTTPPAVASPQRQPFKGIYGMKGVGIELPQSDFIDMKNAGIDILSTEWGMEEDVAKTRKFLDQAQAAGLKVVMDGGFSYTAWGFTDDDWDRLPRGKLPVWQKKRVQDWVAALKDHPAICAWDISNEFGENLPDGADVPGSGWPKGRITTEQLKQARADVLAIDPGRPIHVRMYAGWDDEKMPSHVKSMLEARIADSISLNLYSNYLEHGKLEWPTVIPDMGVAYVSQIKKLSPRSAVWLSIGVFEEAGTFQKPKVAEVNRDMSAAGKIPGLDGITFFCWGPVDEWDSANHWYLPKNGTDLWTAIKDYMSASREPGIQGK